MDGMDQPGLTWVMYEIFKGRRRYNLTERSGSQRKAESQKVRRGGLRQVMRRHGTGVASVAGQQPLDVIPPS